MQQNCNKIINTHYIHISNSLSDYGTPKTFWSFTHPYTPVLPICSKLDSMHPLSIACIQSVMARVPHPRISLFTRINTRNVLNRQRMHKITNMPPLIRIHDNDDVGTQYVHYTHSVYITIHYTAYIPVQTAFMVSWLICRRGSSTNINETYDDTAHATE